MSKGLDLIRPKSGKLLDTKEETRTTGKLETLESHVLETLEN